MQIHAIQQQTWLQLHPNVLTSWQMLLKVEI